MVHSPSVYGITRFSTITPVDAIKRLKKEHDRDPFLTAPAPNTNHIFLENKPLRVRRHDLADFGWRRIGNDWRRHAHLAISGNLRERSRQEVVDLGCAHHHCTNHRTTIVVRHNCQIFPLHRTSHGLRLLPAIAGLTIGL